MVSPSRDQQDLDQLQPLREHPGETPEGSALVRDPLSQPKEHQIIPTFVSFLKPCLICLPQKLKLLEDEYKCLLKMNRDTPGNKSGADLCWNPE